MSCVNFRMYGGELWLLEDFVELGFRRQQYTGGPESVKYLEILKCVMKFIKLIFFSRAYCLNKCIIS